MSTRGLRAVFLGNPRVLDDHVGVVEFNVFDGDVPAGPLPSPSRTGFFLRSFFAGVEATLSRLAAVGVGGPARRVIQPAPTGPVTIAAVRDPGRVACLAYPGSLPGGA